MNENMQIKAQEFVGIYEDIFHNDWSYSSKILNENMFEEGETFINCEWISDWCNKDALDSAFKELQKVLDDSKIDDTYLNKCLRAFISEIEEVFETDWEYTKINLDIEASTFSDHATFLQPNLHEDEIGTEKWENRDEFLKQYHEIKNSLG